MTNTNNDRCKILFSAMIKIISCIDGNNSSKKIILGTEYFESIWEQMINKAFGIKNKSGYFPKTRWLLSGDLKKTKYPLEPDTIMIHDDKTYILDAKYYRYGITGNPDHLPDTSSISKQIIYGEYAFKIKNIPDHKLFNAFLMPYNSSDDLFAFNSPIGNIGVADSSWKENRYQYEQIQGLVLDTKFLMKNYNKEKSKNILMLATAIENAWKDNQINFVHASLDFI